MLDTQIYDLIVSTRGMVRLLNLLTDQGRLVILSTFVQENELASIRGEVKRREILRVKRTKVFSAAGMYGVTPYGEFPYGSDGSEAGLPVSRVVSLTGKHWQDALIACTASAEAEVLVTEDKRLHKRVADSSIRCLVWRFHQFKDYIFELSGQRSKPGSSQD